MAQIKPTVQLRVYKGVEKAFNAKGECLNENQKVTLTYNTLEWKNFFTYVGASGFGIIEVEACYEGENKIDTPQEIADFVANVFKAPEKELTDEQKQIAELQRQNAEMSEKMDAILKSKDKKETKAEKVIAPAKTEELVVDATKDEKVK